MIISKRNLRLSLPLFSLFLILVLNHCEKSPAPGGSTPETALQDYLENGDTTYSWELTGTLDMGIAMRYNLILTSQQWKEHSWKHALTVLVPDQVEHDGALLLIDGGSIQDGQPSPPADDDGLVFAFAVLSSVNKAVVAVVSQIPNQPFYDGLTEDALISYTLHQYRQDGDHSWPLLFPMTKGAVRAMDAVQEFSQEQLQVSLSRFVVGGASKRGWTTWLTGASDERVAAIAPMVIDVLNMPVNLDYQMEVWGEYSEEIMDYVDLGIPQEVHTDLGRDLSTMIDPYSYRRNLTMPKMIFNGTNDPYWPVDAIKHYLDDIPGENFLCYVPNAGHNLGDGQKVLVTLSAFLGNTLRGDPYPDCKWTSSIDGNQVYLALEASAASLSKAILWSAYSTDRDFRDESWDSTSISTGQVSGFEVQVDLPESGFRAFFVDLEYQETGGGFYSKSTRMFVVDPYGIL